MHIETAISTTFWFLFIKGHPLERRKCPKISRKTNIHFRPFIFTFRFVITFCSAASFIAEQVLSCPTARKPVGKTSLHRIVECPLRDMAFARTTPRGWKSTDWVNVSNFRNVFIWIGCPHTGKQFRASGQKKLVNFTWYWTDMASEKKRARGRNEVCFGS